MAKKKIPAVTQKIPTPRTMSHVPEKPKINHHSTKKTSSFNPKSC